MVLNPKQIGKFKSPLPIPPVFMPKLAKDQSGRVRHEYEVDVSAFEQQILPEGFPKTQVFGYGGIVKDEAGGKYARHAPGPTFEAVRGIPVKVKWVNRLDGPHFLPVDGTIHWANPNQKSFPPAAYPVPFNPVTRKGIAELQAPIPIVTHLHGGENPPPYDGHPDAWFTKNKEKTGPAFKTDEYEYLNTQPDATLWYHDHTLGITRLNVYAGLAGLYIVRDSKLSLNQQLPDGDLDVPLVIQDRTFDDKGQLLEMKNSGESPEVHPYWAPENFGNTIMVNGKVWPFLEVKRRQYRFRLLNGSNARFYRMKIPYQGTFLPFTVIARDEGFLPKPVEKTELLLAPGQRADVLLDFSRLPSGTTLILKNDAPAPFSPDQPSLDPFEPVADIMQWKVVASIPRFPNPLPAKLNTIPSLKPNAPKRTLTLNEELTNSNHSLSLLLDGQTWSAPISEKPMIGSTEDWELVNVTGDTHPIHIHLVPFQIVSRQPFDKDRYLADWLKLNGKMPLDHPTKGLSVKNYLIGKLKLSEPAEQGWHDIVAANPGEVTTIRVRFAPIDTPVNKVKLGENKYPFNPGQFPAYVWHCHILDHEDNEMMRPYEVEVQHAEGGRQYLKGKKTAGQLLQLLFRKK
ncbi:multicopper oxidase family protein [Heyndrickxia acidicola]|uniref:Multicopper oxidase n=1 Tax=Heyndrickxia acidicola TaxID=209389 RepID=A0ABU6MQA0_9BACI|nr:multicopper oxidase [Heyndrickxia acidicola]MED1205813.1 multicopper oxidase [Heyndrickxia acidicola]